MYIIYNIIYVFCKNQTKKWDFPWWFSGKEVSVLPLQGAQVQSLVREIPLALRCSQKKDKTTKKTPLYFIIDLCDYFRKALLLKSDLNSYPSVS